MNIVTLDVETTTSQTERCLTPSPFFETGSLVWGTEACQSRGIPVLLSQ